MCNTKSREKLNNTFIMKSGLSWVLGFACQVALCAVIGFLLWQVLPVAEGTRIIGALILGAPFTAMLFESLAVSGLSAVFLSAWTPTTKSAVFAALIVNAAFAIALVTALIIIGPVPGTAIPPL
jgi:hypothetical protein